ARRHDAYHDDRRTLWLTAHGLAEGGGGPDRLEGVVDATRRHLDDRRHGVPGGSVDDVGRAEACREVELPGGGVHRDDACGTGDATALDDREADAAAADDRRGPAGRRACGIEDRAEARGDAAADQRRAVERDVAADSDEGVLVHEHPLREGAEMHELDDRLAVLREPGRLARAAHGRFALAEVRAAGQAVLAGAAKGREAAD